MSNDRLGPGARDYLDTICRAAANGDLGVARSHDLKTGEPVTLLVIRSAAPGNLIDLIPVAALPDDNPCERYADPAVEEPA